MDVNDIISTTSTTVMVLAKEKNGGDCLLLYFRYIIQSRLQETRNTFSTDAFMMKALGWGKERFGNVKQKLISLGMIEPIVRRGEGNVIEGHYVRVNFVVASIESFCPEPSFPRGWVDPEGGKQETNTRENNINTRENNINTKNKQKGEETPKKKVLKREDVELVISTIKGSLLKHSLSYDSVKERMFASNLLRNAEWKAEVDGDSSGVLEKVMTYANTDTFWKGRICSVQAFYYKWATLINQMKAKGLYKQINKEEEERKKEAARKYFLEN